MARNPNRMQEAVDNLKATFETTASILVTVQQDGLTFSNINATVGRTPFDVMMGDVMTAYESRDYLIKAIDLPGIIPNANMRITEANGDRHAASVPNGLNLYESIGVNSSVFKIHTKQVSP